MSEETLRLYAELTQQISLCQDEDIKKLGKGILILVDNYDKSRKEIERLNNIINELEKDIQKEIDRTNDLILEDGSLGEITAIRKMLNDTRQCILFRIKELKEGK